MTRPIPSDVAFTPAVKAVQRRRGSRKIYKRMERGQGWETEITPALREFIAGLDMFYLGTASAEGRPYIQYRGGPEGFLKVLDERTLAFADFSGNQQYISVGNLSDNPQSFLFMIDYERRRRVKIWGTARAIEDDPALLERLRDSAYEWPSERAIIFDIEAWNANCPQHIHARVRADKAAELTEELRHRIVELETQLAVLRTARGQKTQKPTQEEGA